MNEIKDMIEQAIALYKRGKNLNQIASQLNTSPQKIGKQLKKHYPEYKGQQRKTYVIRKAAPNKVIKNGKLTDKQAQDYERAERIYAAHEKSPDLEYTIIGENFDMSPACIKSYLKRYQHHIETGTPYYADYNRKKRKASKTCKIDKMPAPKNPRCKDPDALWKAAYEAGML